MSTKRKVSAAYITKVFGETKSIFKTAKRVSMSYVGAARKLGKLGLVRTKTSRSK